MAKKIVHGYFEKQAELRKGEGIWQETGVFKVSRFHEIGLANSVIRKYNRYTMCS